jgi:hypothetical protein
MKAFSATESITKNLRFLEMQLSRILKTMKSKRLEISKLGIVEKKTEAELFF